MRPTPEKLLKYLLPQLPALFKSLLGKKDSEEIKRDKPAVHRQQISAAADTPQYSEDLQLYCPRQERALQRPMRTAIHHLVGRFLQEFKQGQAQGDVAAGKDGSRPYISDVHLL